MNPTSNVRKLIVLNFTEHVKGESVMENDVEEEGYQGSRTAKGRADKLTGRTQWHQLSRGPRSTLPDKVAEVVPEVKQSWILFHQQCGALDVW